jgi:hypothetical protein
MSAMTKIFEVFHPDLWVGALEGPHPVKDVVGGGGKDEP